MNKRNLQRALKRRTHCAAQHTGWPCGTCFFSMSKKLTNQDWQTLLLYRGDYKEEDLNNLPAPLDREGTLEKIYRIATNQGV